MNGPEFLLNDVPVWSAATESAWLKLLLPKKIWPVTKSMGLLTFFPWHCKCLIDVLKHIVFAYTCDLNDILFYDWLAQKTR